MKKRDARFGLPVGKIATAAICLTATIALAQSFGMKQGLWEFKSLKQVVDGADMSAQMAAAQAQMQQAMANLTPEQRQQMESAMKSRGGAIAMNRKVCVSAAMAGLDKPMVDPQGKCGPANVSRDGNKTRFEINCASDGRTMAGKGESTNTGDAVNTVMDMTMTDARGQHTMHTETEMVYLGADCQGIKPPDAAR